MFRKDEQVFITYHQGLGLRFHQSGLTFEMVVQAISDGYGVSDAPHWNTEKYPTQRIITVMINAYAHLIPYVKDGNDYFLKMIIPSRKENKKIKGEKMSKLEPQDNFDAEELEILEAHYD